MFVFFKQKTAYEMRISDWSSDVCSSDLQEARPQLRLPRAELLDVEQFRDDGAARYRFAGNAVMVGIRRDAAQLDALRDEKVDHLRSSEERRVGKEWVSPGRSRWSAEQYKKKKRIKIRQNYLLIEQ